MVGCGQALRGGKEMNAYNLTKEEALQIKEWRVIGNTWRSVACCAAEAWPLRKLVSGNQIEGMDLCEEAAELLGEDPWSAPWN